jgi:hypothetical protein
LTLFARALAALLGIMVVHSALAATSAQVRLQFDEQLRTPQDLRFVATTEVRSITFRLSSRLKALPGTSLHLFVRHSDNLDADRSFLTVSLNHGILRSFRLDRPRSAANEFVVPIPPSMLKAENELIFFVEQYPRAGADNAKLWSSISARSYLAVRYLEGSPELDLARLPAPLLDPHQFRENRLSVLLPEKASAETVEATALLVANLAKRLAPQRVHLRVVRSVQTAGQPLLVVGTPAEQPQLASMRSNSRLSFSRVRGKTVLRWSNGDAVDEREGLVGLATLAKADPNAVLFVTGNSPPAVLRAAKSLLSADWNASGAVARVVKDTSVAPPKAREWPGFIPTSSFFKLAELGVDELKVTPQNSNTLSVALHATPDARFLDYGNRMVLKFRLAPEFYVPDARLLVQLNDVTLFDEGLRNNVRGLGVSVAVTVPPGVLKPRNVMRIVWKGTSLSRQPGAVAWLLPTSEFYLPRYHEAQLPDLGLLRFQLFPFSLRADLSDVLVVLPGKLNQETFSALLELSAAFAKLAPGTHLAFRVRALGGLTQPDLAQSHLIFLNLEAQRDPLTPLLGNWKGGAALKSRNGKPVIREMASPWNAEKYVLVVSAHQGRLHRAVSEWFSEHNLRDLRGDIAYLGAKGPESFVLGPRLTVTEYSYALLIEAWLRTHWLVLPLILIAVSALLLVAVRLALRHYGTNSAMPAVEAAAQREAR